MPAKFTETILTEIANERVRQEDLRASGKFLFTCASSQMTEPEKLAVLSEEFGEVGKEVTDGVIALHKLQKTKDITFNQRIKACKQRTRKELIQVAAVCVAWAEALDEENANY